MAYYNDYEYDDEEDDSDLENEDEIYNMKVIKRQTVVEKIYETFDEKVAKEIVNIHRNARSTLENRKFTNWVNENIEHLENLHNLSDSKISFEKFVSFIYDHT